MSDLISRQDTIDAIEHVAVGEGENRYDNEHHEDGSLKWTWLECERCGRKTNAYCYEHQATDMWDADKVEV